MFANNRHQSRKSRGLFAALAALALAGSAIAGEPGAPVKIEFLPPPMEGTISLGVYDTAGKLVRSLHREAEVSDLMAGDNGLITQWDGKDDKGAPCPSGKYSARGVMVGELATEGIDFVGNDWVTDDDSPHIWRITDLGTNETGMPVIAAKVVGQAAPAYYAISLKPAATPGDGAEVQLTPQADFPKRASTGGFMIINGSVQKLLKDMSAHGFFHIPTFTMPQQPGDPRPVKIAASQTDSKLYVLYENAFLQRLRGYDFTGFKRGSEPKELFECDIWASDTYEQIVSQLKFEDDKQFVASPVLTVSLVPNPLFDNKPGSIQIRAGVDKEGGYLATTDGLLLCHVSDTKELRWAAIGQLPGTKPITFFDSDGAVVEQFRISHPSNMMTFDAGAIQWVAAPAAAPSATPPAASPGASATPTPVETPAVPTATPTPSPAPSSAPNAPGLQP